jgi:peroxin-3
MKGAASIGASSVGTAVSGMKSGMPSSISEEHGDDGMPTISPIVRNAHMARCRIETSRAMIDFLPTLKKAVAKETDVGFETEELKLLRVQRRERSGEEGIKEEERSRERELWNTIKNKSVTRLVTTVYAHSIVFLVLTVQVNLLGGRLLREEVEDETVSGNEPSGVDHYRSSHKMVLAKTYQHVFSRGIPCLAKEVSKVVDEVLKDWDVLGSVDDASCGGKKNSVSIHDVSSWINHVRDEMERPLRKGMAPSSALAQFIIPEEDKDFRPDMSNDETKEDELAAYILDETYDLLESPTFADAERKCLDATFSQLYHDGYAKLFSSPTPSGDDIAAADAETIPLANVVSHLQKMTVSTFYKPPSKKDEIESWGGVFGMMEEPLPSDANSYIPILERLNAVLELGHVCFD